MSEPRTHYQISLTARQAVGLFAGLLLALGLAFFFGLMTGYSGRTGRAGEKTAKVAEAVLVDRTPTVAEALPPVETGVPLGAARADAAATTPPPVEPTTPATIHPFDDSAEDEAAAAPPAGSRTSVVGAGPAAAPPPKAAGAPAKSAAAPKSAAPGGGKVWVQAGSLSSHDEANALSARLSKHGFHAVVLAASGPKGKVYRVRVGPYRTEDDATRAMAKLTKQEKIREPWIVPDGK